MLEKLLENILLLLAISRASMHAQNMIYKDILQKKKISVGTIKGAEKNLKRKESESFFFFG